MGELLRDVLPLALGAAVSPIFLTGTLVVLSGRDRPLVKGLALAAGAAVPLLLLGLVGLALFAGVQPEPGNSHAEDSARIDMALGATLLLLGLRMLKRTPTAHEKRSETAPDAAKQTGLLKTALLGFGMMATNFTTAVLYIAALKLIARSDVDTAGQLGALAMLVVITLMPVLIPLAIYAVAPEAANRVLTPLGAWVRARSRPIGIAMLIGFGIYLLVKGLTGL
jgi:hypothetical protein